MENWLQINDFDPIFKVIVDSTHWFGWSGGRGGHLHVRKFSASFLNLGF